MLLLLGLMTGVLAAAPSDTATLGNSWTRSGVPAGPSASVHRTSRTATKAQTDAFAVYAIPQTPKPGYLVPTIDPTFGSIILRIANDDGKSTGAVAGVWGFDTRHVYSVQQPWNSDNTLLTIENRGGGNSLSPLILDGTSYLPEYSPCPNYPVYDYRWHPSRAHPHEQINVDPTGTQLMWFDVTTCTKTRSWPLPFPVDYGIGSAKGNPSDDGRFVALGNNAAMFVVDMDPQPPFAPYPNIRIGPTYLFPPESLTTAAPNTWTIDHLGISPSGRYVKVKFGSADDCGTFDMIRVFEVDSTTLELKPHNMADASERCCTFQGRPNGWIFPLKHSDFARDPFDNNEDVLVGGRSCTTSALGPLVKVRMRDGAVTQLIDPDNVSSVVHVSTRNTDRPGWAFVSWYPAPGKRFSDEITAVSLDGSESVVRMCHVHTADSACYRCEAQPVPSRDGTRVLFASNWALDCGSGCGPTNDIKDYIATYAVPLGVDDPPRQEPGLALRQIRPNPARLATSIQYSLDSWAPARIELLDIAGRHVLERDLGAPGPGSYAIDLEPAPGIRTGLYIVRLTQDGRSVTSKLILRQ